MLSFISRRSGVLVSSEKGGFAELTIKLISESDTTELPEKREIPTEPRSLRAEKTLKIGAFTPIIYDVVAVKECGGAGCLVV